MTNNFPKAADKKNPTPPLQVRVWSATKVSLLLGKDPESRTEEEQAFLQALYRAYPLAEKAGELSRKFKKMSDKWQGEKLDEWIEQALTSGIEALKNVAQGLQQDYDAVKAALTEKWSNGPVEGQINRLKTIKRQMYGRAGFKLLKKRVLADTG